MHLKRKKKYFFLVTHDLQNGVEFKHKSTTSLPLAKRDKKLFWVESRIEKKKNKEDIILHFVPKGLTFLQKSRVSSTLFYSFFDFHISTYFFFFAGELQDKNPSPWEPLKVSKFQKQIFLLSFEPKKLMKLFFDFCPKDLK